MPICPQVYELVDTARVTNSRPITLADGDAWCRRCVRSFILTGGVLARPERFELPTLGFEVRCSIQLSYGRRAESCSAFGRICQRLPARPRAGGEPVLTAIVGTAAPGFPPARE
jgi:hypothetical protein